MRASRKTGGWSRKSRLSSVRPSPSYNQSVIYCVIPPELADELFDKMVEYYKDNPNVTVIIDRRSGPDRRNRKGPVSDEVKEQRTTRDRRRQRVPGTFPETEGPSD